MAATTVGMASGSVTSRTFASVKPKLHDGLLRGLDAMGYQTMTAVQEKVLTELPGFRSDCVAQAKTGTGKTLAFLLPVLHSLLTDPSIATAYGYVAVLIISPTRELAEQIAKECDVVTAQLPPRQRPECATAYGGVSKEPKLRRFLAGNVKVLVATPGRLNDYLDDENVAERLSSIRTLILDEADTMLDAGFLPAVRNILRRLPPKSQGWQGMCFSATMPAAFKSIISQIIKPGHTHLKCISADEVPTVDAVQQSSIVIPEVTATFPVLLALLQHEYRLSPHDFKVIVFGATANGVALMHALFSRLFQNQISVLQLQSRLSQPARTRITQDFKSASAGLMFASDVIGRGMDFPNVNLVIQVGLPMNGEQYIHRVGRTARAGMEGRAVIILTERESYFLKTHPQLPIKPFTSDLSGAASAVGTDVTAALYAIDDETKRKAYQAWLGFHKAFSKPLRLTNEGLVEQANAYAASLGCPETPLIDKQVVGKMGLKGTRGLNVGHIARGSSNGATGKSGWRANTEANTLVLPGPLQSPPHQPVRIEKKKPPRRRKPNTKPQSE